MFDLLIFKAEKERKSMLFRTFSCGRKELVKRVLAQNIWMLLAHMAAYLYSIADPNFIWPIKFDKVKSEGKDISVALSPTTGKIEFRHFYASQNGSLNVLLNHINHTKVCLRGRFTNLGIAKIVK